MGTPAQPHIAEVGLLRLQRSFPNLNAGNCIITSSPSRRYNCIALAAGDLTKRWEHNPTWYWPGARSPEFSSLVGIFLGLGYVSCGDDYSYDPAYQKVALYSKSTDVLAAGLRVSVEVWTHAAFQMCSRYWKSKCGDCEDICHELHALDSPIYGAPNLCVKRPKTPDRSHPLPDCIPI
jgi:hypothetical protein